MTRWLTLAGLFLVGCGQSTQVIEPAEVLAGKSQTDWSASYWQWVYSLPAKDHPLVYKTTGDFCNTGQPAGEVFFLGTTFGGDADRDCTVPAQKSLFFPVFSGLENNYPTDTLKRTAAQLAARAKTNVDAATFLRVELDGSRLIGGDVEAFAKYRQTAAFSFQVPDVPDNIPRAVIMVDFAGSVSPAASDGYWVALRPLPPGAHTLKISAKAGPPVSDEYSVEYRLIVN